MVSSLPLLSCELSVSVKENPDRKKIYQNYDVTTLLTNNYNTHIRYISRNKGNQTIKLGQLIETFFLKNHTQNMVEN